MAFFQAVSNCNDANWHWTRISNLTLFLFVDVKIIRFQQIACLQIGVLKMGWSAQSGPRNVAVDLDLLSLLFSCNLQNHGTEWGGVAAPMRNADDSLWYLSFRLYISIVPYAYAQNQSRPEHSSYSLTCPNKVWPLSGTSQKRVFKFTVSRESGQHCPKYYSRKKCSNCISTGCCKITKKQGKLQLE